MIRRLILPSLLVICLTSSSLYAKGLESNRDKSYQEINKQILRGDFDAKNPKIKKLLLASREASKKATEKLSQKRYLEILFFKYANMAIKEFISANNYDKRKRQVREIFLSYKEFASKSSAALDRYEGFYNASRQYDARAFKQLLAQERTVDEMIKDKRAKNLFAKSKEASKKADVALKESFRLESKSSELIFRALFKISNGSFDTGNFAAISNPKVRSNLSKSYHFLRQFHNTLAEHNRFYQVAKRYENMAFSSYLEAL